MACLGSGHSWTRFRLEYFHVCLPFLLLGLGLPPTPLKGALHQPRGREQRKQFNLSVGRQTPTLLHKL